MRGGKSTSPISVFQSNSMPWQSNQTPLLAPFASQRHAARIRDIKPARRRVFCCVMQGASPHFQTCPLRRFGRMFPSNGEPLRATLRAVGTETADVSFIVQNSIGADPSAHALPHSRWAPRARFALGPRAGVAANGVTLDDRRSGAAWPEPGRRRRATRIARARRSPSCF